MLLRKINAIISLLTTIFLLDHAVFSSVWMLSKGSVEQSAPIVPRMLVCLMAIHAFISIYFAISAHKGCKRRKVNSYPKMNSAAISQRVSGLLLIVFTALHVAGAMGAMQLPGIAHDIVPPVFFTIALAHAAVSTSKAFITLGIGSAKFIKGLNIAMKLICVTTLIADIIGFYLYIC